MANVEHVALAAPGMKQFDGVFPVDLFAQAIHVDFDRVRKRIKRVVPYVRSDLRARDELARAPGEILENAYSFAVSWTS